MSVPMTEERFEKVVKAFWSAMIEIYGKRWEVEHETEATTMWRGVLEGQSVERIHAALELCRDAGDQHPINLSTFVRRLKSIRIEQPQQQKALPPKPVTQEHQQAFRKAADSVKSSSHSGKVRSVLTHGESYTDFLRFASEAMATGKTMFQVKWERLNANGWTIDDEKSMYESARRAHYALYEGTTNLLVDCAERK